MQTPDPDLIFYPSRIPDPKKAPDPGSWIRNTVSDNFLEKKLRKKIFIFSYYFFPVTDDSDEPTGFTRHLPRRLLAVHVEQRKRKRAAVWNRALRLENDSDTEDEDEQRPVRPPSTQWTPQDPGLVGVNTPEFIKPVMSDENREKLET